MKGKESEIYLVSARQTEMRFSKILIVSHTERLFYYLTESCWKLVALVLEDFPEILFLYTVLWLGNEELVISLHPMQYNFEVQ